VGKKRLREISAFLVFEKQFEPSVTFSYREEEPLIAP
jgi:hypothetical protein